MRRWIAAAKAAAEVGGLRTEEGKAAAEATVAAVAEQRERAIRVLDRRMCGRSFALLSRASLVRAPLTRPSHARRWIETYKAAPGGLRH